MGDFNDLLNIEDKLSRVEHPQLLFDGFRDTVRDCHLIDLHLKGYPYTWWCGRGFEDVVGERLDRAMVTSSWLNIFPNAKLTNLVATMSDHSPILLNYIDKVSLPINRRFKFENAWLLEEGSEDVVRGSWHEAGRNNLLSKLDGCANDLEAWGCDIRTRFIEKLQDIDARWRN